MSMQSRTKKLTLLLLCGLALAGLASCSGGGESGGGSSGGGPVMRIYPPMTVGSIPGQTVAVGGTRTLDVGRYFRDANGDRLTYRIASGNASVATVTVSGSVVTIRGVRAGTATVHVTARDPGGLSANQDFSVRVSSSGFDNFPSIVLPRSQPQETGTDLDGIEVAGVGSTRNLIVRNTRGSAYTLTAGTWYEPKDGAAQRMIITRTTFIPSGRVVQVPAACMQRGKAIPANGLRFFSQFKTIRAGVQSCQRNCLSRDLSSVQSCVWGCESSNSPPAPPSPPVVVWQVDDRCNDRYLVRYRFLEFNNSRQITGSWPGSGSRYSTQGFRSPQTRRLTGCTPGRSVCIGADFGSYYFGVGDDGSRSCSDCCVRCSTSSGGRVSYNFGCPRN